MRLLTHRGYALSDCASATQKAIRRGDARLAGYFAIEIFERYPDYLWRRLLTISAEDCHGLITQEIKALHESWQVIHKHKKGAGRIFAAKAVILLCLATKSRDADHLTNLIHDAKSGLTDDQIERDLAAARAEPEDVPDYAHDCHTANGKRDGKTKTDFFLDEQAALSPRKPGLFDDDVEALRTGRTRLV